MRTRPAIDASIVYTRRWHSDPRALKIMTEDAGLLLKERR